MGTPTQATIRACAVDRRRIAALLKTCGDLVAAGRIVEAREYAGEAHVELTAMVTALAVAENDIEMMVRQ